MVSLTDEAYKILSKKKLPEESFSKAIVRLSSPPKKTFMDLAGKWPGGTNEAKKIFDEVLNDRHKYTKTREFEL